MRNYNPNTASVSTSMFARALATENIFVCFDDSAKTATFNLESRVLTIPNWNASEILRDMLVAHEVAHAIFTPTELHMNAVQSAVDRKLNRNGYKACLNVIEDARIERLIKEKFPGCRRDFYAGYKEVLGLDIFKLKGVDLAKLSIVDKINLHFKFGLFGLMNISFTPKQQEIVDRVQNAKTYEDVIGIANDLYAMQKEEAEAQGSSQGNDAGEGEDDTGIAILDVGESLNANSKGKSKKEKLPFPSYAIPKMDSSKAILSYSDILAEIRAHDSLREKEGSSFAADYQTAMNLVDETYDKFHKETKGMVQELAMQFERRKAAEEIRNEREKPCGNINPDRLHQFRTHDDIFLRNLVKYEGKKHGMVMLVDWSGSMADGLDGVVRQILLLTWFCRKIKVPYEVFLYTDYAILRSPELIKSDKAERNSSLQVQNVKADNMFEFAPVHLRQVFTNTMTDEEHEKVAKVLWSMALRSDREFWNSRGGYSAVNNAMGYAYPPVFSMNSTPTIESLMAMHDYLPKFRQAANVDIVNFMFVTDGEPNGLSKHGGLAYEHLEGLRVQHLPTGRTMTIRGDKNDPYLASTNLHLQYFFAQEIQKLGVTTIGFSIGGISSIGQHYLNRIVYPLSHSPLLLEGESRQEYAQRMDQYEKKYNDFYKKENFIPASPDRVRGFHEYYVMRPIKPNVETTESITPGATLTRIRNQFVRAFAGRKCSRIFLSRFVDILAGRKVQKYRPVG